MQLRRITSSGSWVPQIDGLRFVAIVSVLLFHIAGQMAERSGHAVAIQPRYGLLTLLIGNGDRGVLLFFVISGTILARPFLRQHRLGGKRVAIGAYYLRRVTRLEPPYILCLFLCTAPSGPSEYRCGPFCHTLRPAWFTCTASSTAP